MSSYRPFSLIFIFGLIISAHRAGAQSPDSLPLLRSEAAGRQALSLVIYNRDLALVTEKRLAPEAAGVFRLRLEDVGGRIIPSSVQVDSYGRLEILEQQYDYDLLSKSRLLQSFLGRKVTLERLDPRTNTPVQVSGTLLSLEGGTIIQFGDRVEVDPEGRFSLPEVPGTLALKPALTWLVKGKERGECRLDISYLTAGLSWSCDYVLALGSDKQPSRLTGWVTIQNNSGAAYPEARVVLMAGDINRVAAQRPVPPGAGEYLATAPLLAAKAQGGAFTPETDFEYWRYSLDRSTSLPDRGAKQIELFRLEALKASRIYRFENGGQYYYGRIAGDSRPRPVDVYLEWENSGGNYPGMPLPAGTVRIYAGADSRTGDFLGEDRLGQTPRDEKVSIRAGSAFDLLALKKQTDFKQLSDRLRQVSLEIELTNRKAEAVTVQVDESLPGDWKVTESSLPYERLDSGRIRFAPQVRAGGKTTISYTVQLL